MLGENAISSCGTELLLSHQRRQLFSPGRVRNLPHQLRSCRLKKGAGLFLMPRTGHFTAISNAKIKPGWSYALHIPPFGVSSLWLKNHLAPSAVYLGNHGKVAYCRHAGRLIPTAMTENIPSVSKPQPGRYAKGPQNVPKPFRRRLLSENPRVPPSKL